MTPILKYSYLQMEYFPWKTKVIMLVINSSSFELSCVQNERTDNFTSKYSRYPECLTKLRTTTHFYSDISKETISSS